MASLCVNLAQLLAGRCAAVVAVTPGKHNNVAIGCASPRPEGPPAGQVTRIALLACLLFWSSGIVAQPLSGGFGGDNATPPVIESDDPYDELAGEFAFVRLQYDSLYQGRWGYGSWSTDFPAADNNFLRGVSRLSNIRVMPEPLVLRLDDEEIFEYPILYALEMGRGGGPRFSPEEIDNLRQYLLRGGFLLVDDFWGSREWDAFENAISAVFPDREIVDVPPDHEIFSIYYDIAGPQMIPALGNPSNRPERDATRAVLRAIMDDSDRIMMLINWNTDMGDGWEHTYHPGYPTRYANLAYQMGLNYLIYTMTH